MTLTKNWRQDLLNLKKKIKQNVLDANRALDIAQKIKGDNTNNLLKPDSDILNAHIHMWHSWPSK